VTYVGPLIAEEPGFAAGFCDDVDSLAVEHRGERRVGELRSGLARRGLCSLQFRHDLAGVFRRRPGIGFAKSGPTFGSAAVGRLSGQIASAAFPIGPSKGLPWSDPAVTSGRSRPCGLYRAHRVDVVEWPPPGCRAYAEGFPGGCRPESLLPRWRRKEPKSATGGACNRAATPFRRFDRGTVRINAVGTGPGRWPRRGFRACEYQLAVPSAGRARRPLPGGGRPFVDRGGFWDQAFPTQRPNSLGEGSKRARSGRRTFRGPAGNAGACGALYSAITANGAPRRTTGVRFAIGSDGSRRARFRREARRGGGTLLAQTGCCLGQFRQVAIGVLSGGNEVRGNRDDVRHAWCMVNEVDRRRNGEGKDAPRRGAQSRLSNACRKNSAIPLFGRPDGAETRGSRCGRGSWEAGRGSLTSATIVRDRRRRAASSSERGVAGRCPRSASSGAGSEGIGAVVKRDARHRADRHSAVVAGPASALRVNTGVVLGLLRRDGEGAGWRSERLGPGLVAGSFGGCASLEVASGGLRWRRFRGGIREKEST